MINIVGYGLVAVIFLILIGMLILQLGFWAVVFMAVKNVITTYKNNQEVKQ